MDSRQYSGVNPVPSYTYHAADSAPVGYANLQPQTASNAYDVTSHLHQATYS